MIGQEYLPAASEGDMRLFVLNGRPLRVKGKYAAFRRVRGGGDSDRQGPADRADLLGDLEEPVAEAILDAMEDEEAAATRALREYPDDVAGGLMTLEYLAYSDDKTIADVLEDIRSSAGEYRDFVVQYVFATSRNGRLTGVLRLRDLLFARQEQTVRALMIPEPLTIAGDAPLDEVRAFFDAHTLYGVPVVDDGGRLLGMLRTTASGHGWRSSSSSPDPACTQSGPDPRTRNVVSARSDRWHR